jgi:hypothetical protein
MDQLATAVNIASWEIVLVLFLIGGGFLLGVLLGRDRIFLLLIGSYISYALMSVVPFKKIFPKLFYKEEDFVILIVAFLVLIGLIYFLLSRSLLKTAIQRKGRRSIFQIFFLSIFLIGILLTVVFSFFPDDLISQFSSTVLKIFNTSLARTLWLVIPLIFVGLFRKKKRYSRRD